MFENTKYQSFNDSLIEVCIIWAYLAYLSWFGVVNWFYNLVVVGWCEVVVGWCEVGVVGIEVDVVVVEVGVV